MLLLAVGMVSLVATTVWARSSNAEQAESYAAGTAFLVTIIGFVLSGPWLTALVARGIARFGRRAPSLLAARRLQDNPAAGFHAISGIILAVFVGSVFAGLTSSILARQEIRSAGLAADVVVASYGLEPPEQGSVGEREHAEPGPAGQAPVLPRRPALPTGRTTQLVHDLAATPGVEQVVTAHALPDDPDLADSLVRSGAEIGAPVLVSCSDATALGFEPCDGATVLNMARDHVDPTGFTPSMPIGELADLPVVGVAAVTDGRMATIEQARTRLELGIPGAEAITHRDIDAEALEELDTLQRVSNIGLSVTLVIAGCSLAVAVAGAIVERRQPLALLRLAGTRLADLRRMVLAEAAAPLLIVAAASVGLGLTVAYLVLAAGGGSQDFVLPGPGYWLAVAGGLGLALLVVMATLPLLSRLTSLDSTRFE